MRPKEAQEPRPGTAKAKALRRHFEHATEPTGGISPMGGPIPGGMAGCIMPPPVSMYGGIAIGAAGWLMYGPGIA